MAYLSLTSRLSRTHTGTIAEFKARLDEGEEVKFTASDDVHNITGLLKSYIRDLPQPLLAAEYFQEILNIADFPYELHAVQLRKIVSALPKHNQVITACGHTSIHTRTHIARSHTQAQMHMHMRTHSYLTFSLAHVCTRRIYWWSCVGL